MNKIKTAFFMVAGILLTACNGAKTSSDNPFFSEYKTVGEVPPFDKIKIEHYKEAFLKGMEEQAAEIEAIANSTEEPTFENVLDAYDKSGKLLRRVSYVFFGINSANTSPEMQQLSQEMSPLLSAHSDNISMNKALFEKIKVLFDKIDDLNLNDQQRKFLDDTYKNFVRSGALLNDEDQAKLRKLNEEISLLQIKFGQNVLAETNEYQLVITNEAELDGLPESLRAAAKDAAGKDSTEGYKLTLHNPSIMPFLQFSSNRKYREEILAAYLNRGNNNNDFDNKEIVKDLVNKRLERAKLLGYDSAADYILENRMAKNAENVNNLLTQLWEPAIRKANEELAEMKPLFLAENPGEEFQAHDWRYYSEKVRQQKYNLDTESLRPYFALDNVRDGIFYLCNKLYGISFEKRTDLPVYHEDVTSFECLDADGSSLGYLYLDFFPRESKRGGAWCGSYRLALMDDANSKKIVTAITTIVCNFSKPTADTPALLTPDEVQTFFHEFGHALHNLFKEVSYYGIASTPRDFVELPSQVMEHWAFEPQMLAQYARHYKTGEVIPNDLVEKLDAASNFGQGFATTEYLAASVLDMDFHTIVEKMVSSPIEFEDSSMKKLGLIAQIPPRYRSTYFNHTMGGGYTAGYYSYIWSEVLDADAFDAYKETNDIFDKSTAEKFRKHILAPGSTYEADQMYRNFRGKDPNPNALLKYRGL